MLGTVTILKSPFISSAVSPLVAPKPAKVTVSFIAAPCALAVVTVIVPELCTVVTVAFICVGAATATVGAVVGDPDGYITKDGQWAAVPFGNSDAKLAIINNGKIVHTARNYSSALTYIKKQISAGKKRRKKK